MNAFNLFVSFNWHTQTLTPNPIDEYHGRLAICKLLYHMGDFCVNRFQCLVFLYLSISSIRSCVWWINGTAAAARLGWKSKSQHPMIRIKWKEKKKSCAQSVNQMISNLSTIPILPATQGVGACIFHLYDLDTPHLENVNEYWKIKKKIIGKCNTV